jgi:V/A-type H+-transporting ATPase subunit A
MGKVIRLGYLQQNAFHKDDTYVPLNKQLKMMDVILYLEKKSKVFIERGKSLNLLIESGIFDKVIKMKYDVPNDQIELLDGYSDMIDEAIKQIH